MSDPRTSESGNGDVVRTAAEAAALELEPLIVVEPLMEFLDSRGLGSGEPSMIPIGDGHSNVTFLIEREGERFVLRRPPRGPLPPSAHDVLREARLLAALRPHGIAVPEVLALGEDESVLGAPFYVMEFVEGWILGEELPVELSGPGVRERIGEALVDGLVRLHEVDPTAPEVASFGRPDGYLARQLKRFNGLLEVNATRPLPELETVAEWLTANLPTSPAPTVVHGDYRLGNVMFEPRAPRIAAILDWEMATIGDPLADLGYMTAMWAEAADPANGISDLSPVTREPGFLGREALARRYAEATGRSLEALPWYQVLACWKGAIFLEGSFKRFGAGTTADPFFASLDEGVPALARLALELSRRA